MPNQLNVAMIDTIVSLRQRGWSQRRIARELGINRETVARYLRQPPSPANPAIAPSGDPGPEGGSNQAIAPPGSLAADAGSSPGSRLSDCEPWCTIIQAKLDLGLSAKRIHLDLTSEHGFAASYYSVRRFVCQLEVTHSRGR
ncbi:MAG: helix-turn-helix domain-containing protein [Ancrocorticia sp.]